MLLSKNSTNSGNVAQFVLESDNRAITTSLLVAQKFEKRHDDVLKAIRNLETPKDFWLRNFAESKYDKRGKQYPMYVITKDGFTMLVMSFTGPKASAFKVEYIEEFNRMESLLKESSSLGLKTYSERVLSDPAKSCPKGYWTIFDGSHAIMLFIEKYVGCISKHDLVDGSIGALWAKYREGQPWAKPHSYYTHQYKDERGPRECKCYQESEYFIFKDWLLSTYKPNHLLTYLKSKYNKPEHKLMIDKINKLEPRLLTG